MAELSTTVRFNSSLQSFAPNGGVTTSPDNSIVEFQSSTRIERQVYKIAGNLGTKQFIPNDEGFTGIDLFKIEVLTPNKSLILKFNGDPTGVTIKPVPTPSGVPGKAFMIASATFNIVELINPDPSEIMVSISAFEKTVS